MRHGWPRWGPSSRPWQATEPDQGRKAAVGRVRAQVLVVHGVVDSVALSAVAPSDAAIGHLQEQATILHTETARARAELFPTPQTPTGGTTR